MPSPPTTTDSMRCPVCSGTALELLLSREDVAAELTLRERFFAARIDGPLDAPDMKDRTDVLHATGSAIRLCRRCDVLVREPDARAFDSERYADFVMEKILRSNIDAFRRKERLYRPLLPDGAEVVEIGSYVGGFLHVAREWKWIPTGVDPGEDTAQFTASRGYPTRREPLEECRFANESFGGAFVWNTFEQIDPPAPLLAEIARVLRPGGILVIRTPNASFYREREAFLTRARNAGELTEHDPTVRLLAWNNLLGFPHRFGYAPRALDQLLTAAGFAPIAHHGDTLITPTHARLTASARREQDESDAEITTLQNRAAAAEANAIVTPWFEAVYRK